MACAICHEELTERPCHTLEECNHTFHTACAIRWFRSNGSCPLCRGEQVGDIGYLDTMCRYKLLRRKSRARGAPRKLKGFVERIRRAEDRLKQKRQKLRELRKIRPVELDAALTVQQLLSRVNLARNAVYTANKGLWRMKRTLGLMDFETAGFRLPNVVSGPHRHANGRRSLRV